MLCEAALVSLGWREQALVHLRRVHGHLWVTGILAPDPETRAPPLFSIGLLARSGPTCQPS